jgi:hypothetical protein
MIGRATLGLLCGATVLTAATFLACGGPKPIGVSSTATNGQNGTGTKINLGTDPTTGANTGTAISTDLSAADGGNCGITTSSLTKQPADLLLVLDKTGSLTRAIDGTGECATGSTTCQQRWATLKSGLDAVLAGSSGDVNWGLQLFNATGGCTIAAAPQVPIGAGSAATIQTTIAGVTPNGNTPTRLAINAAVTYLKTLTDTNGKYILLATDGEPNCLSGSGGGSSSSDVEGTRLAIAAAAAAGFKVYVIGVGPETGNLDNFATAGGTGHYYPALSPQELNAALASIVGTVASCTFNLTTVPQDPTNVVVEFNGDKTLRAPRDINQVEGWNYTSSANRAIQLYGSWCDNVTNGTYTSAMVLMGCGIYRP